MSGKQDRTPNALPGVLPKRHRLTNDTYDSENKVNHPAQQAEQRVSAVEQVRARENNARHVHPKDQKPHEGGY